MRASRAALSASALSALICGLVGVGVAGKVAGEPPDIGHGGEALRGDALHTTLEGCAAGYRHHRRAHHAGIEKLAFGQPLGVGGATRGDRAVFDRDEVCGGGAHIHE